MKPLSRSWVVALLLGVGVGAWPGGARSQPAGEERDVERDRRMVEVYRQMLSEEPGQDYAYRRLLETAHAVGGLAGLVRMYEADVERSPRSYSAWLVLGQLHATADNLEAATQAFDKAAALEPQRAEPWLLRAELHRERRAWADAFAAYDKAAALLRDKQAKQDTLRAAAEAAIDAGEVPRAADYFQRLIATEPGNVFLRMLEASTLARLDQAELALQRWQDVEGRAAGQLQHLVVIWKEMAELQSQLGRHADAEATWRKGLSRLPVGHFERRLFLEGLIGTFRRQDRLSELVAELLPDAGRDFEVLMTVARLYEELALDDQALAKYREAQKKRPTDEEARTAALRILERIGKPDEILQAWLELVRAVPREPRYELKLAEVYFLQGRQKEGQDLLHRISKAHPLDPGVHQSLVDLWLRYGERAARTAVENEYKILAKLEPDHDSHVVSLGAYYWSIEDRTRALATWKRLLKLGKKPGEGHFMLAEVYAEHELLDEALGAYREALTADPQNERYLRAQALLFERMGRHEDALAAWRRLLDEPARRTAPMLREAREHVIQLWEKGERLDGEIEGLGRRFEADPPDLVAGRFLAAALLRLGRLAEARVVLERLDAHAPDDVETLNGLVQVYSRENEPRKAIAILERLARVSTRGAVDYLHRAADLALNIGDEALALRAARQVVELNPGDPLAHARVGDLYIRMAHRAEAAEAWRQALALDPRNFPVRFKLASLYRDLGNVTREEQVLTEIVREAPDPADVLRAGRRLVQLGLATGRLADLERALRPLVDGGNGRDVQRRLVVEVYALMAQSIRWGPEPRAAREAALTALGERGLRPLLDALEDNDVAVRALALSVLEATHPPGATPALARLAQEAESVGQVQAIAALGRTGTAGAVAALARILGSQHAATRDLATWALGLTPTAEARAVLAERVKRGPQGRLLVAAAIGRGRHPDATPLALELARDPSADVREMGLWALGRLASPEAVPTVAERLARGTTREMQLAAWGLGRVARAYPADPSARAALVAGLWIAPDDAVWTALGASHDDDDAVDAIYDALASTERRQVGSIRATLFVAPVAAPSAGPEGVVGANRALVQARVREVLGGADEGARLRLANALLAGPDGLTLLPPGRFPRDHEADKRATLAILGGELEGVLEVVRSATPEVQEAWVRVLARWPEADHQRVLAALDQRSAPLSAAALEAWTTHAAPGDPRALERAETGSRASDPALRMAATRLSGAARSEALLVLALQDAWPQVRALAAGQLGHLRSLSDPAVGALVEATRDPDPAVVRAAARALASEPQAHGRRAILERLQASGSWEVRREIQGLPGKP
ncbi:MAG: HEAT repeat domain-containing protein [Deltaproteobacteria bacterium]|nr:HEAT repeat domain-containing protein [Deltaproteobacteria bacterium]